MFHWVAVFQKFSDLKFFSTAIIFSTGPHFFHPVSELTFFTPTFLLLYFPLVFWFWIIISYNQFSDCPFFSGWLFFLAVFRTRIFHCKFQLINFQFFLNCWNTIDIWQLFLTIIYSVVSAFETINFSSLVIQKLSNCQ